MDAEDRQRNTTAEFTRVGEGLWVRPTDNFVATLTLVRCENNTELWNLEVREREKAYPVKLVSYILTRNDYDTYRKFKKLVPYQTGVFSFDSMDALVREATLRLDTLEYW